MLRKKFILFLIVLAALAISASAAFFSVYGLSKVFAGASFSVIIMASVLEASKLITAYSLHEFKGVIPTTYRNYLGVAVLVLMIITSAGIYGFLSNAYQLTAASNSIIESEIGIIEARIENRNQRLEDYKLEREAILNDISSLRQNLSSGSQVQYIDQETGQLITTSSRAVRESFEAQLEDAMYRRDVINNQIESSTTAIDSMKIEILNKEASNDAAAELGPLIYLSNVTGIHIDQLVNYFILMIIFVFDPLAVCLVIVISYISSSFTKNKKIDGGTRISSENRTGLADKNSLEQSSDISVDFERGEKEEKEGRETVEENNKEIEKGVDDSLASKASNFFKKKDNKELIGHQLSLIKRKKPITRIVDNGQRVQDYEIFDELVSKPVYSDENISDIYSILTPSEFNKMSYDELRDWYEKNKHK